jgi:glycosyltransferase involved in cell wall biosynthesis
MKLAGIIPKRPLYYPANIHKAIDYLFKKNLDKKESQVFQTVNTNVKIKNLRLLFITNEFLFSKGGSSIYAHELVQAMAKKGVEIHVMAYGTRNEVEHVSPNIIVHWHRVIHLPLLLVPSNHIQVYFRSKRLIKKYKITSIHSNNSSGAFAYKKLPMVTTIHHAAADEVQQHESFFQRLIYRADCYFEKRVLEKSSIIIVDSHIVKKSIKHIAPNQQIKLLPCGVDFTLFRKRSKIPLRNKVNVKKSEILLFFPGGIRSRRKGALELFSALQGISFSNYKCIISGEPRSDIGWRQEFESKLEKSGLEDRFIFIGEVNYNELPAYYSIADIVVYPSIFEGFGLPALEALACGKPLICTRTGEMAYIVQDGKNGLVVNVGDVTQLQSALTKLMTSAKEREKISRYARKSIEHYSWDTLGESIIKLHMQVLKGSI